MVLGRCPSGGEGLVAGIAVVVAKSGRSPSALCTSSQDFLSRVNYICRFLLPHSEMLPKL